MIDYEGEVIPVPIIYLRLECEAKVFLPSSKCSLLPGVGLWLSDQ
ncbi:MULTISPECIES: hypothetical protein [Enterococcus]|nr:MULTISPECIES: hypothetical protein [Enterococcus]